MSDINFLDGSFFYADMARFNKMFTDAGAVHTEEDGFTWIDNRLGTEVTECYQRLVQYGYANGLI